MLVTVDAEDASIRNLFRLFEKFYSQILSEKHRSSKCSRLYLTHLLIDGEKLIKSILRHLVDIFTIARVGKTLLRTAFMLQQLCTASSQNHKFSLLNSK